VIKEAKSNICVGLFRKEQTVLEQYFLELTSERIFLPILEIRRRLRKVA